MWLSALGAWIAFLSIVKCQTPPNRCTDRVTQVTLEVSPFILSSICADNSPAKVLISSSSGFWIEDVHGFCTSFDLNIGSAKMDYILTAPSLTIQLLKNGNTLDAARIVIEQAENKGSHLVSVWGHQNTRVVLKIIHECIPGIYTPTASPSGTKFTKEKNLPVTPSHLTTSTASTSVPDRVNVDTSTTQKSKSPQDLDSCYGCSNSDSKHHHQNPIGVNRKDNSDENQIRNGKTLHRKKKKPVTPSSVVLAKLNWMEEKRIAFEKKMKLFNEYIPEDEQIISTTPIPLDDDKDSKNIETSRGSSNYINQRYGGDTRLASNAAGSRQPVKQQHDNKTVHLDRHTEPGGELFISPTIPTVQNNSVFANDKLQATNNEDIRKDYFLYSSSTASFVSSAREYHQQWLSTPGASPNTYNSYEHHTNLDQKLLPDHNGQVSSNIEEDLKTKSAKMASNIEEDLKTKSAKMSSNIEDHLKTKSAKMSSNIEDDLKIKSAKMSSNIEDDLKTKSAKMSSNIEDDLKTKSAKMSSNIEDDLKTKSAKMSSNIEDDLKTKSAKMSSNIEDDLKTKSAKMSSNIEADLKTKTVKMSSNIEDDLKTKSVKVSYNVEEDLKTISINPIFSSYPIRDDVSIIPFISLTELSHTRSELTSEYHPIMPTSVTSYSETNKIMQSSRSITLSANSNSNEHIRNMLDHDLNHKSPLVRPAAFLPVLGIHPSSTAIDEIARNTTLLSKAYHMSSLFGEQIQYSEVLISPSEMITVAISPSSSKSAISQESISSSFDNILISKVVSTSPSEQYLFTTRHVQPSSSRINSPANGKNAMLDKPVFSSFSKTHPPDDSNSVISLPPTMTISLIPSLSGMMLSDSSSLSSSQPSISYETYSSSTPTITSRLIDPTPVSISTSTKSIQVSKTEVVSTSSYETGENVENSTIPLRINDDQFDGETFWPVVAALVVGIPSVIVFGIAIVVIHRRRSAKPTQNIATTISALRSEL